ncbi:MULTISPECIES: flagellar motor switch protein FliN [Halomonadaceae]|jgi:flagellar motor switch protein FliN/FliY|uniref:Flagellar motor switch protein FliN n=1 Tax=Vreelandella aquamarina TaxID=77097 RepID=A0A0D7UWZ2_9GAMM|nr:MULTISPECIES: flagellar motor switch protein FliN [Halomonas]KTG27836.1 flagellar motor switch protein FliN [Idiomarina sp. H105]MEC7295019.1 flagellar motor switch protein FliN [Pseudomonadota bacterium]OAF06323.1 flagellar motor switch protein FliN [Idiomarina sp. WRN-38]KJD19140.1 flagellar motor switch protein FliN [Halomonas meridiana]MAD21876.1 flagellar motor switch protein FliN [Halomonas sp.]|tara:strand:+ start:1218 stop:1736 length:519 start_codon:yes stop_codon:yes gene_type:complete
MTDPNKPDQKVSDDDWAEAMSEQEEPSSSADAASDDDDPWAAAMAEQEAAEQADTEDEPESEAPQAKPASDDVFRPLSAEKSATPSRDLEMIMDIPVKLTVELGRTKLTIKQLLELAQGSVIELEGLAGEPMDILINGYLIAQGEVVVIEDKYGIRITEIITPSERIHKLNR